MWYIKSTAAYSTILSWIGDIYMLHIIIYIYIYIYVYIYIYIYVSVITRIVNRKCFNKMKDEVWEANAGTKIKQTTST